jgi:phage shock protein PspC (stress-responsive transcriptional regulator)
VIIVCGVFDGFGAEYKIDRLLVSMISWISLKVNDTGLGKWLLLCAVRNAEGTLHLG